MDRLFINLIKNFLKMKIKSFEAKNFKGLQNIAFELSETEVIQGQNGAGKTSNLDAISWVI